MENDQKFILYEAYPPNKLLLGTKIFKCFEIWKRTSEMDMEEEWAKYIKELS